MRSSLLAIFFAMLVSALGAEEDGGFAPKIDLALSGNGYGDVYGGKVKEGVYGAGGRVGGNLGLKGDGLPLASLASLAGRKRRQVPAGILANNTGASSMTGAQHPNGAFSVSASSAGGEGTLSMNSFQIPAVGRKRRQAPAGIVASNNGASSLTGAQNPDGAFSVSGSSSGGAGTLSLGSFQIPTPAPARKRRDVESGSQEVEGSGY